jgi:hypothetical protein
MSIVVVVEFCETVFPLLQYSPIKDRGYSSLWPVARKFSYEDDVMKGLAV